MAQFALRHGPERPILRLTAHSSPPLPQGNGGQPPCAASIHRRAASWRAPRPPSVRIVVASGGEVPAPHGGQRIESATQDLPRIISQGARRRQHAVFGWFQGPDGPENARSSSHDGLWSVARDGRSSDHSLALTGLAARTFGGMNEKRHDMPNNGEPVARRPQDWSADVKPRR